MPTRRLISWRPLPGAEVETGGTIFVLKLTKDCPNPPGARAPGGNRTINGGRIVVSTFRKPDEAKVTKERNVDAIGRVAGKTPR